MSDITGCSWAPKLARTLAGLCAEGQSPVYGHKITKFSRTGRLSLRFNPPSACQAVR